MKKLYRKGTVHPSPPPAPAKFDDHLSFLPVAILSLAVPLLPEEKELLAYLLLYNPAKKPASWFSGASDHAPEFACDCFRCYMSYWARWGSSPNHQLIHDIIEAYDDHHLENLDQHAKCTRKGKSGKKEKRRNKGKEKGSASNSNSNSNSNSESKRTDSVSDESTPVSNSAAQLGRVPEGEQEEGPASTERVSNVRRLASFIGEKIWGVWG